ncbi:MAG: alkaline phosphatase family protein [Vicinamibacteria bacterium]|nr:alkaline phosphatase family protein [Vicinamibacteria bacterium]
MTKYPKRALFALATVVAVVGAGALARRLSRPAAPARSVIVVGLDAADWQILDEYRASGAMPQFDRLVREGRAGVLQSLYLPLSPLVWTTMATGRSPLEHRILDFTRFNPQTGAREPITSDERRAKAVWEMASESGLDVAVFALWATHPAEPVKGLMVSDRLFSFLKPEAAPAGAVSPASEEAAVHAVRAAVEASVSHAALREYLSWLGAEEYATLAAGTNPYAHPATALRRILIETRLYHRLALERLRRAPAPALTWVYFQGTDSIGHVFAPYAPPRQPSIEVAEYERYHGVAEAYFREVDRMLGEYRAVAEQIGATLFVVSDHGFFWKENRPTRVDSFAQATAGLWHRTEGISVLWGRGIEQTAARGAGQAAQVASTILALLGLPRGAGLAEPALAGVVESAEVRDWGPRTVIARVGADSGAEGAIEKLKALGYVAVGEPASRPPEAGTGARTAGSFNNEGTLLGQEGRRAEARAAYEQALRVDPHSASTKRNLSDLLRAEGEVDAADAMLLDAFGEGLGDGPRILFEAATQHFRDGDAQRGWRLLDGAIERRPDEAGLRLNRGRLRLDARDCAGAFEDFDRARRTAPRSAVAQGLAGTALMCLGRVGEGRAALERSLELDPSQERLREQLARLR